MAMSKSQAGLGVVVVAGAAAIIFLQYQTGQKLRAENEDLSQQIASLKSDNSDAPSANSQPTGEDRSELLRLRGEVGMLRAQTNQIAKLQNQNQQLREAFTNLAQQKQQQQPPDLEEAKQQAFAVLQINTAKQSVLGMMMYASDNQDQFPTNFDQAAAYFGNNNSAVSTNLGNFEIVYRGTMANVANPAAAVVVRSVQPFMSHGKWAKAYGFADGHAEVHSDVNGNFDEWEQQHVPVLKNQ
jgi:cell division protein FtsB